MQIVGAIICALAAFRLTQSILRSFQARANTEAIAARSLALLDEQIAATKALRIQREHQHLHWNGYRKFRVGRKVQEAEGTTSLYLYPHDNKRLPTYQPGQYLTFRFQFAGDKQGELRSVVRCYSLSDAPHDDYFRITVKRVSAPAGTNYPPGCISNHVQDHIDVGDILDVQAPRGEFCLDPHSGNPVVLIAGGVGVTPLLSMLNAIVQAGTDREVWFFYGVRNRADHIMQQHLQTINDAHPNVHLFVCYSQAAASDTLGTHYHHAGRVTAELIQQVVKVSNFDFYLCGPPAMMESLVPALQHWGVVPERIHTEAFGPATVKKSPKPQAAATQPVSVAAKVTVQFSRSGKNLAWDESSESLLDFALHHGITIDSGCRIGSCGTCLVAVKQGKTQSRVDADAECDEGSCLTCVSVPVGDVVLDA